MSHHFLRRRLALLLMLPLVWSLAAPGTAQAAGAAPPWQGSAEVMPHAYRWLDYSTPSDTYAVTVVRGATVRQVMHRLGHVRKDLGRMTFADASGWSLDRMDDDYSMPTVIQVCKVGPAVVVLEPWSARGFSRAHRITRKARLASFITDIELDTYVKVEKHQHLLRRFDTGFRPPRKGALPEEKGLHFGRKGNQFARSWAFLERLTLIHLSHSWVDRSHPTYVFRGSV